MESTTTKNIEQISRMMADLQKKNLMEDTTACYRIIKLSFQAFLRISKQQMMGF